MLDCPIYWVNAFGDAPLTGNSCVVVLNANALDAPFMQRLAREFGVGETCFLINPVNAFDLWQGRIFTPVEERPYAGVPILAMAYGLVRSGKVALQAGRAVFSVQVPAGKIQVDCCAGSSGRSAPLECSLLTLPARFDVALSGLGIAAMLGLSDADLDPDLPVQVVDTGTRQLLVHVRSLKAVLRVALSADALNRLRTEHDFASLRVFCLEGYTDAGDCFGRHFYAGAAGVAEDPFTGSSAASMAAYLWHHGVIDAPQLVAEQGHALGRPGCARLEVVGSRARIEAVRLSGSVRGVFSGFLQPGTG